MRKIFSKFKFLLKNYIYHKSTIIIFDFPAGKKVNFNPKASVDIKYASFYNLNDVLSFQPKRYIKVFREFLLRGDKGYFAYVNSKCVGRYWTTQINSVYPHFAYSYKLKENEVFIHYCETSPKMRGLGIYPFTLIKIINDFLDKYKLISVDAKNTSSIKGIKKVGFRERERVEILIILGIKRIKVIRL